MQEVDFATSIKKENYMAVRIIVDSTADMPAELKKRCYVVPLTVHFGDKEYVDGVTIDHKTFYEKLVECDTLPRFMVNGITANENI